MTVPSTEELQRLLNEATPGEITVKESKWGEIVVANQHGHDMSWGDQVRFVFESGDEKVDTQLFALAPGLAAEVIRLREAIETVAEISETRADNCHASHQLVAAVGHRETSRRLTRILEGDQAWPATSNAQRN